MGTKFSNRDRKRGEKSSNRDIARELMSEVSVYKKPKKVSESKSKKSKKKKLNFFKKSEEE